MGKPLPPDFSSILAEIGISRFFEYYWQKRTLAFRIPGPAFESVLESIGPFDVLRLCELAREGTRAWLANDVISHSVIPVNKSNAERFFNAGATLYFVNVMCEPLSDALAAFLGAPRSKVIASFFLTPAGGGAVPHFDKNENFTIQLTGTKQWLVDDEPAVASPSDGYVLGQSVPSSLTPLLPLPDERSYQKVELDPGMLLYVPRGTVHQTATGTVAWSLNLSYSPSMWIDLLMVGLRRQLSSSRRWRATVTGVGLDCNRHAYQANLLPELVRELQRLLDDPEHVAEMKRQFLDNPDG
jgi:ribosomal protein L16 Arg81 hydroxylase